MPNHSAMEMPHALSGLAPQDELDGVIQYSEPQYLEPQYSGPQYPKTGPSGGLQ